MQNALKEMLNYNAIMNEPFSVKFQDAVGTSLPMSSYYYVTELHKYNFMVHVYIRSLHVKRGQ